MRYMKMKPVIRDSPIQACGDRFLWSWPGSCFNSVSALLTIDMCDGDKSCPSSICSSSKNLLPFPAPSGFGCL